MDDLERLLRKYRVGDPPDSLRDRIIHGAASARRPWREWLLPVGAVAAAIVFYALADRERQEAVRQIDGGRVAIVTDLSEQLGGDADAREAAERVVNENEAAAHREMARYETLDSTQ